jgi:hypothetical protein
MPTNHFGTFIKHEHGANFVNTMREVAKNKEMNIVEIDCNQLILDENIVFEAVAENRGKKTIYLFDDFNMLDEDKQQKIYYNLHQMKLRMNSLLDSFYVFGILVDKNWDYGKHELALDNYYTDHGVCFNLVKNA